MEEPEIDRITKLPDRAESLLHDVVADMHEVEECYPDLRVIDTRRAALPKLVNAVFPAHMGLLFLRERLFDSAWCVLPGRSLNSPAAVGTCLEEFERSVKFGLLMSSFSGTESTLRRVATAITPSNGSHPTTVLGRPGRIPETGEGATRSLRVRRSRSDQAHQATPPTLAWESEFKRSE